MKTKSRMKKTDSQPFILGGIRLDLGKNDGKLPDIPSLNEIALLSLKEENAKLMDQIAMIRADNVRLQGMIDEVTQLRQQKDAAMGSVTDAVREQHHRMVDALIEQLHMSQHLIRLTTNETGK